MTKLPSTALLLLSICGVTICAIVEHIISLAAYAVKVWNPTDREYEQIADFDGDGADAFDFLHGILDGIKTKTLEDQPELQAAISVAKLEKSGRKLSGIIQTGQYGYESDLINVKTTAVVYKREKDDAEMLPFYFYFEIPDGVEDGIVILQRTGALGIRKILHWVLKLAFENKYPEFKLRLSPIVVESEVERFLKGKIQKIQFIKKDIPSDIVDSYDKGHKEVHGTMSLTLRATKDGVLPMNTWLTKIFRDRNVGGVFVLGDEEFAYNNIKAQVKLGYATRTINAADPARIRSYFDITDTVKMGRDGHPQYNSIKEEADKLSANLHTVLYGSPA